jgi:hypothetical protein
MALQGSLIFRPPSQPKTHIWEWNRLIGEGVYRHSLPNLREFGGANVLVNIELP